MDDVLIVMSSALGASATVYGLGYACGWAFSTYKAWIGVNTSSDN